MHDILNEQEAVSVRFNSWFILKLHVLPTSPNMKPNTKKQPLEVFYKGGWFFKFRRIQKNTPVLESLF